MAASNPAGYGVVEVRDTFNLFVYGTLKRGESSHDVLGGAAFGGRATVGGVLYSIDDEYPALVLYGNTPIEGEIWKCPTSMLATLDTFEDVDGGLFRRVGVCARLRENNEEVATWTYTAGPRLTQKLTPSRRITKWPL